MTFFYLPEICFIPNTTKELEYEYPNLCRQKRLIFRAITCLFLGKKTTKDCIGSYCYKRQTSIKKHMEIYSGSQKYVPKKVKKNLDI